MRKGATFTVLPGQTNGIAILQEGCVGQILGHAPIEWLVTAGYFSTRIDDAFNRSVEVKVSGIAVNLAPNACSRFAGTVVSQFIPRAVDKGRPIDEVLHVRVVGRGPRDHLVIF